MSENTIAAYEMGVFDGIMAAVKIIEKEMRRHRRYISNGRKMGLSDTATHNDHVMALALRDVAARIRATRPDPASTSGRNDDGVR